MQKCLQARRLSIPPCPRPASERHMQIIDAAAVDLALSYPALVDTLASAFRQGAVQPVRHHHTIERPDGAASTLLLMPAWQDFHAAGTSEGGYAGVKIVTVAPDNNLRGKPAVTGVYLLMDGKTGEPLALIDGQRLTLWRTAAASALAGKYLAREDAAHLLLIGAGALAPYLARAHAAVRPIRKVSIWNRSPERAQALAEELAGEAFRTEVVNRAEDAAREADIVTCITLSQTPVVCGDWLKPGAHVDLVGAFRPNAREADDAAVKRSRVYVDTRRGALKEAGDIVMPIAAGVLKEGDVQGDLFELCRGQARGRQSADEITLFKSVGTAIEDLAAAMLVWKKRA